MTTAVLWDWIEAIHSAVMETGTLEDFDGISAWWYDVVTAGLSSKRT